MEFDITLPDDELRAMVQRGLEQMIFNPTRDAFFQETKNVVDLAYSEIHRRLQIQQSPAIEFPWKSEGF